MIIDNARLLTLDSRNRVLECGSVEIRDGCVARVLGDSGARVSDSRARAKGPSHIDRFDARGRLLMPALINCHTHLYSTLARGISLPGTPPRNFPEILKTLWWRLDRALNEQDIYYSALIGIMDSARCGVGTLVDHHSSPSAVGGSLDIIERAFSEVGVRGVLCYETTDRNGPVNAQEGIVENIRFLERACKSDSLVRASFGLHASFTLSDRTLRQSLEANHSLKGGFHVHVSEDLSDNRDARKKYGKSPVRRLHDAGVLDDRALAAHCIHVSAGDIGVLARRNINVVHNPQSNCNNAVGTARVLEIVKAGVLVGLGSDGYSPRMWDEFKTAFHLQKLRAGDPRVAHAEAYALALLNNRTIAKKIWGLELGRIEEGARADLALYDYYPPTPLAGDNIFGHALFGIAHAPVHSLIVNGKFVIRDREFVNVDERAVAEKASTCARELWRKF